VHRRGKSRELAREALKGDEGALADSLLALAGHDPERASPEARAGALVLGEALVYLRAAIRGLTRARTR